MHVSVFFQFWFDFIKLLLTIFNLQGSSDVDEYSNSIMAVFFTVFRMIMVDDFYYSDIMKVRYI